MISDRSGVSHAAAQILNAAGIPAADITLPDNGPILTTKTGYAAFAYGARVVTIDIRTASAEDYDTAEALLGAAQNALADAGWTIKHTTRRSLRAVAPKGTELPAPPEEYPYIIDDEHTHNGWVVRDATGAVGHIECREIPRDVPGGAEAHWDGYRKTVWAFTYTLTNPDYEADIADDDIVTDDREYESLDAVCEAALAYYPTYQKAQAKKYGRP